MVGLLYSPTNECTRRPCLPLFNDATPGLTNRPNGFHNTHQPTPNIRYRNTRVLAAGWNKGLGFGANVSRPMLIPHCKSMSGATG